MASAQELKLELDMAVREGIAGIHEMNAKHMRELIAQWSATLGMTPEQMIRDVEKVAKTFDLFAARTRRANGQ